MTESQKMDRRGFFMALGRALVLGGMAAAGVWLARRGRLDPAAHRCVNKSVCCNCALFARCGLPAALSAKQAAGVAAPEGDHRG